MTESLPGSGASNLDRECAAFSVYLIGHLPTAYVLEKYRAAHILRETVDPGGARCLDRSLVRIATWHPLAAKLVDAYTAIFLRKSLVRRKWILLLAILESSASTSSHFDLPDTGGKTRLIVGLIGRGVGFALALGLSIILLMPLHLMCAARN